MTHYLSSSQLRGARGLLNWTRAELAERSGVSEPTLHRFENNMGEPEVRTQDKIRRVFEFHGIEFLDNSGIRFKPSDIEVYEGQDRFNSFYDFLYEHLKMYGGEVCLSVVDERLLAKYRKDPELHRSRMKELVDQGKVTFRIIATESNFYSTYAQYRRQPKQDVVPTSFYAFGNCLALISFVHDPAPYVVLHKSGPFAEAYRQSFNIAWEHAKRPPPKK